jgi:Tfp pilus assembly protein FimV
MNHRCFNLAACAASGVFRMTLLILTMVMCAPWAQAAESAPTPSSTARTYTVLRGDTLDRVIQKTMPGSPLKIEILRNAFVDLNPQAFASGNMTRPKTGAVLQVPDHVQLLRASILPVLEGAEAAAVSGEGKNANASERRSWVRFP